MPVRQRKPNEVVQQVVPLVLLAVGLISTNNSATFLDDEASFLGLAAGPLRFILAPLFSGTAVRGRSPLYEVLLHFWLRSTDGNFDYFRIPSILFFLAGLFLLGRVCRQVTGAPGGLGIIWLGVLWPFAFHFARLATWFSFSFFLVAGVTLGYFKYLEERSFGRRAVLFVFCAALIWTTYFGWAILACLAVDQAVRSRAKESTADFKTLLGTAALLAVSFIPLFPSFRAEVSSALGAHHGALAILAGAAFNVYSLFVGESFAPWYWWLGAPAAAAIVLSVALAARWTPRAARRFLYYGAGLIVLMAPLGILNTNHLLMLSAWVLLPIGVAIESVKPSWAAYALAAALLLIGATGWYGIYSRRYYSAPRFLEPWQEVAADAGAKISGGATVISDRPAFLLYLTYFLRVPSQSGPWKFAGLLPDNVRHPQVYSPVGWLSAAHPPSGKMILVRQGSDGAGSQPVDQVVHQLDQACGSISSRLRLRDAGYKWKQRFFPQFRAPQWRIEIREYDCDSSPSKQIYRIPPA